MKRRAKGNNGIFFTSMPVGVGSKNGKLLPSVDSLSSQYPRRCLNALSQLSLDILNKVNIPYTLNAPSTL